MKACIFDLDGTLINSLKDIAISMNIVLKKLNFKEHSIERYRDFIGDGSAILVKNALPSNTDEETSKLALKYFIETYESETKSNTFPYDGIYELLEELEKLDIKLAILSNKPHKFTLEYKELLFKENKFLEVHGQKKDVLPKPHPIGAINIAASLNISSADIFYIGDTPTDIKTAQGAKMKSIGVAWGFRPKEELVKQGADYIANTPNDILEILKKSL